MVLRILTRAPHDVRISNAIHSKKQKKTEKNVILLRNWNTIKIFAESWKSRKFLLYSSSLAKLVFFLFFSFFSHESYSASLQHVVPLWKSSIQYKHTLFQRCKKRPVRATHIWDPYTRGSKKAPKKVPKKSFRRAWISDCYIHLHFAKTKKSYKARPAAILEGQDGECAPHRSHRTIYN